MIIREEAPLESTRTFGRLFRATSPPPIGKYNSEFSNFPVKRGPANS